MSFKSTPHRITAPIRDFRPFQGSRPAFIRTVVKDQLKVARTLREQLTRHQRIVDLLKYKLGEDRLDMVGGQLIIFLDMVEQRRVL